MDITFVLCPNIIGLLGLSILLIFTRLNFYLDLQKIKLFRTAAILNMAIILFEVADYLLGTDPFQMAYLFRRVTSATGFALSPVFPLFLARMATGKRLPRWVYIPAAVNVLMCYGSIFTGHLFWIDACNSYYRGPLFIVMMAISVFYLGMLINISYRNFHGAHSGESAFLICIIAFFIIGNLLEMLFFFHFVFWNGCAVLLICYYLYLHIQYFKYDPLTKTFIRSVFLSDMEKLSHARNIAVVSFDLDNLKKVNDQEGHERGDEYIIAAVQQMRQAFSDVGRLYRVGGDEFVILAANTTEEMIRERKAQFHTSCANAGMSISCGYAFSASGERLPEMLHSADKAMYENKRQHQMIR